MLNYTVCTWPVWRALLAQSLTIAAALLIEIGMVEQGLAGCDCTQKSFFSRNCMSDRPVTASFPHADRKGPLEGVVKQDWVAKNEKEEPLGDGEAKCGADMVENLHSNDQLFKTWKKWRARSCICVGDTVCFPPMEHSRPACPTPPRQQHIGQSVRNIHSRAGALAATMRQSFAPRNDVYARGTYVGSDTDANVRFELHRDSDRGK